MLILPLPSPMELYLAHTLFGFQGKEEEYLPTCGMYYIPTQDPTATHFHTVLKNISRANAAERVKGHTVGAGWCAVS